MLMNSPISKFITTYITASKKKILKALLTSLYYYRRQLSEILVTYIPNHTHDASLTT